MQFYKIVIITQFDFLNYTSEVMEDSLYFYLDFENGYPRSWLRSTIVFIIKVHINFFNWNNKV